MKKFLYIILIIISALVLTTCRKRPELKIYNLELSEETVVTSTSGATITANYSYPGAIPSVTLFLSNNSSMVGTVAHVATVSETTITATLDNLAPNTKYYYYFRYSNGINLINTETKNFTTEGYTLPEVSTVEISEVASNSAHCCGEVTSAGNGVLSAIGICYGTRQNPNLQDNVINCGDTLGVFETDLTNLDINTQYYVRAFATNEAGTAYGEQKAFTTLGQVPTVITIPITSVTSSSAISGGSISNNGGNAVIEKGVCWSTVEHPTIADPHTSDGSGNGAYISNLAELLPNTLYYVRAYATNSEGTGYGNELTFTTSASLAVLTTKSVTEITQTSAKCGGNITNSGGMDITVRGVCWSTSHNPTTNDNHTEDGSGIGEFDSEITGLTANVKYYVRAYATSDYGTSYGNEVEFTTQMGMPTVTTKSVTGITASSASCGGNVTNSGGGTISARGVCWSTEHEPSISENHTTDGTGTGEFTSSITGLSNNVTYYVRAYATNSNGTSYGEERSFTTQEGLAVITTNDVTSVTATSATCGGEITDDGGFSITARGVCWSTNQNPTTEDAHTSDGTGTGSYSSSLASLSYNTTYYVRAYATNSKGTSYGEEKTFTTNKLTPTVTTTEATSVTSNSAVTGGNVTSDGGANVTARGVCYGTSQNPSISGLHTSDGNGTGEFTSSLTGLTENTTYYVRAYATNSEGTSYGSQKTFITSQNVVVPTVTTSEVTNISTTSASCGGNITSDGNGTISARGVCWSTSQNPTISNSHTTDGTGSGTFTSSITGLTENTTYYVRAYATNEAGTNYGDQKTFTTPHATTLPTVTTNNVTEITQTTAVSGGNVTSAGYGTISAKGVCWSTSQNPTVTDSHTTDGTGTGSFTSNISGLSANTTYYVRAYATNEVGTNYGEQKSFTTLSGGTGNAPTGAIDGLFSISSSQQVYFSKGNLIYKGNGSVPYWKFADYQWTSWIRNDQQLVDSDVYLFGWGTSGYNHGALAYMPQSTGTSNASYYAYGQSWYNLYDQTRQADWGYNAISNGGNSEHTWRVLTYDEWVYLLYTRSTTSGVRYAKAKVNGYKGVIILPDNWSVSYHNLSNTNQEDADYTTNEISSTSFVNNLEAHGAVFLPVTGCREGTTISMSETQGYYWSSSRYDNNQAYAFSFSSIVLGVGYANRCYGMSVRLVYDPNAPSIITPTVTTNQVTAITSSTATCGGNVTSDGGASVIARGVCWSTSQNPTISNSHTTDGTGTGLFTSSITGLTANTTYHVRAYATNSQGTSYGDDVTFTTQSGSQVPTGAINGLFTINANGDKVYFSKGNLQYQASTNTWRFAENQWNYVGGSDNHGSDFPGNVEGSSNNGISSTYSGWIDLFGWGTSGYNHGAVCYQPWSYIHPDGNSYYYAFGNPASNLTGIADWGYNAISNGGNTENQWRTPAMLEWAYIVHQRNTSSGLRFAKAIINDVNGVILLPDNWNSDYYPLNNTNALDANFSDNTIDAVTWSNYLEENGAVFLPTAYSRNNNALWNTSGGYYWSTTREDYAGSYGAYRMYFNDGFFETGGGEHLWEGLSVRLVQRY